MKQIIRRIFFISPLMVSFVVSYMIFNPKISPSVKMNVFNYAIVYSVIVFTYMLLGFINWTIKGFKLLMEVNESINQDIVSIINILRSITTFLSNMNETVVYDPKLINQLKEKTPNLQTAQTGNLINGHYGEIKKILDSLGDVKTRMQKLEQNSPFQLAILAFLLSIGIGVVGIIAAAIVSAIGK